MGLATTAACPQPGAALLASASGGLCWASPPEGDLEGTRHKDEGRQGALASQLLATVSGCGRGKPGNRSIAGMLGCCWPLGRRQVSGW